MYEAVRACELAESEVALSLPTQIARCRTLLQTRTRRLMK